MLYFQQQQEEQHLLYWTVNYRSENKAEGHILIPDHPQVSNHLLVDTLVCAFWHSCTLVSLGFFLSPSLPYHVPDCRTDSIKHPVVCPTACRQCCGLVCVLAGHRGKWEDATGAGPLCLRTRGWQSFMSWSCSLLLVERLMKKLATDCLNSITRMIFLFFSHAESEAGPGL